MYRYMYVRSFAKKTKKKKLKIKIKNSHDKKSLDSYCLTSKITLLYESTNIHRYPLLSHLSELIMPQCAYMQFP